MRKIFGIPMVLSMLAIPASVIQVRAQPLVEVNVGVHAGYVAFNNLEDDIDWDNMIVVNNDRIGFWVMLPSGHRVFRCRNMWYDYSYDEWRYGPWWYDYNLSYNPFDGIRFHVFMQNYYPRYHERYFYHNNGIYFRYDHRYNDRYDNDRGGRTSGHNDYNAPRVERSEPAIHREKGAVQQVAPVREREKTAVVIHESAQPVRTDGGNRVDRIDRSSHGPSAAAQTQVVRERSAGATRGQPSSNGTRVTRTETRREMQRR